LTRLTRQNRVAPRSGEAAPRSGRTALRRVLSDRALLIFGGCAMLFNLGNAAMLPLVGSELTRTVGDAATLVIAICIVLPELVMAAISPAIGRLAEKKGRRFVLLLGICTLPIRGGLLAVANDPTFIVLVQILDGGAAACFGVLVPLVTSDVAG